MNHLWIDSNSWLLNKKSDGSGPGYFGQITSDNIKQNKKIRTDLPIKEGTYR